MSPDRETPPVTPPRIPSTWGGVVYLVLAACVLIGLLAVAVWSWRSGVVVIGAGLLVASVMRVVLPEKEAGMLGVRSRWFDVVAMLLVGGVLITLALTIPDQPV